MCYSLHVAVNVCINCSFFTTIIINAQQHIVCSISQQAQLLWYMYSKQWLTKQNRPIRPTCMLITSNVTGWSSLRSEAKASGC